MVDAAMIQKPPFVIKITEAEIVIQKDGANRQIFVQRQLGKIELVSLDQLDGDFEAFFGLVGVISLYSCQYFILIDKATLLGTIRTSPIYRIDQVKFVSFQQPTQQKLDENVIQELKQILESKTFYFSYKYDITHNLQHIAQLNNEQLKTSMWQRANYNYFWNNFLCEEIIEQGASIYILPIINGYVKIQHVQIKQKNIIFALISRRDHRRTGTRHNTRGLDEQGNTANFVETEQIIQIQGKNKQQLFSYVILRGSIPLLWEQRPNLRWTPKPKIYGNTQQIWDASQMHFMELMDNYGDIQVLNLIDKKGHQNELGSAYAEMVESLDESRIGYSWFDFYSACAKDQYQNIGLLLSSQWKKIDQFQFFQANFSGDQLKAEVIAEQSGVFRVNCMDCIDRTNIIQSVISRNAALKILSQFNLAQQPDTQPFTKFDRRLEKIFAQAWAENGDALSQLYTGSSALKSDVVLCNKRTLAGRLKDAKSAIYRYFQSNFNDGQKQNAIDILLGNANCQQYKLNTKRKWEKLYRLLISIGVIGISALYISQSQEDWWKISGIWALATLTIVKAPSFAPSFFIDQPLVKN